MSELAHTEQSGTHTATLVRVLDGFRGDARLYRVVPPVTYEEWGEDEKEQRSTDYVVVNAAVASFSGPETYIFPANEQGRVIGWGELDGSFRGGLDHAAALQGAGYEVAGSRS